MTTSYTYWPDHTRRTATTTTGGVGHTTTYHYATDGKIADETYAGGGPAVTATYLLAVNREARTLDTAAGAAQDTGAGTGYYLTDAHGSVTAMIDASGAVTASYAYSDYGQPDGASPALLATPAADPAGNAAINPFTYDGAYTNPTTGTQYLPARTYDPDQGRFLTADAADQFNRYQAFDTNPITTLTPPASGRSRRSSRTSSRRWCSSPPRSPAPAPPSRCMPPSPPAKRSRTLPSRPRFSTPWPSQPTSALRPPPPP